MARSFALTLRALATFVALNAGFRLLGFGRTLGLVRRRRPVYDHLLPTEARRRARDTFRAVQNATMLYFRRREDCLHQALTTWHLLRRQGISAELCFGVAKYPFGAHSWVDAHGEILDDDPERIQRYTVIYRLSD